MHAVGIEEIKGQDVPQIEKLLERLGKEKEKYEVGWREQGIKDGRQDAAEDLHYVDLLDLHWIVKEILAARKETITQPSFHDLTQSTYGQKLGYWDHPVLTARVEYYENEKGWNRSIYVDGWREGVFSIYWAIRDKIISAPE